MTIRQNALIQAACVSLLLMLLPGTAASQDQAQPVSEETGSVIQTEQQPEAANIPAETTAEQEAPAAVTSPSPTAVAPAETETPAAKEEFSEYTIKQGDTLWDIANAYLRDPFLWPFIWKANPSISNPDLIYAGNKLLIPALAPIERAMQAPETQIAEKQAPVEQKKPTPEETKPAPGLAAARVLKQKPAAPEETTEEAPRARFILPEEKKQPIVDKYSMLSAGYVDTLESSDKIIGAQEKGKTIYGYGDIVYVSMRDKQNINVGDKFLIYAVLGRVNHPITGDRYGRLIRGLGVLQIIANDPSADVLTAKITLSFDDIENGDLLTPYQEPSLVYPTAEKKSKDISGYILEVTDRRTISGQTDFVYLDKGSADGVEPGDSFTVYAEPEERGYPKVKIGEVQVFLVKEHSSTAIVRKSIHALTRGDEIAFLQ